MNGSRGARGAGVTMVEALIALLLTLLVVTLMGVMAARHRAAWESLARRMEVVEARRVARDLVEATVEAGGVRPIPGDRLGARSFVGWATLCPGGGWRYRGRRLPYVDRDSVWVVSSAGETWVSPLSSVGAGACDGLGPGEAPLRLGFDLEPEAAILARIFESGRYQLYDALRYGRDGDPAQPLTGAVLDGGVSGITASNGEVTMVIRGAGDSASVERRWWTR